MKYLLKSRSLSNAPLIVCIFLFSFFAATPAMFAQTESQSTGTSAAIDWLKSQQQADGGFEVAGYPGFETPDVIAAIASAAQSGSTYSPSEAYAAVSSVTTNFRSPLDYVDDLADGPLTPSTASKLITWVAAPLGLNPRDFDPSNDSPSVRDLVDVVALAQLPDGSFGAGVFNTTLTSALALDVAGNTIPNETVLYVLSAQAADGSFNYAGDANVPDGGADTTALAIEVLIAAGRDRQDLAISNALTYLATTINTDGSFSNFGTPDPNSTAVALRGLNASGVDLTQRNWRDYYAPSRSALAYSSPSIWLISQQAFDGHFVSPYDSYGVNTLATSQATSAIVGSWFPLHSLEIFRVPDFVSPPIASVSVQGTQIAQSSVGLPSARGTLANTGSDARDVAIVAVVILVLGACTVYFSQRRKK